MERENRYVIIKRKDAAAYLDPAAEELLDDIVRNINRHRLMDGKSALTAVVVEHDWPEYEPTWAAIAARVDGGAAAVPDELDDDHPRWLINEQIKGLLEGDGAPEDHEDVLEFLRATGLPSGTVTRMHRAIVSAETRKAICERACEGIDTETLIHAGVVQRGELVDVLRRLDETRQLIADDGFACTFQSLGQYRSALLKSITATAEDAFNAKQAEIGGMPYGTYGGF